MILHIGISCPIPLYVEAIELVHYPAGLIAKQIDQILWGILGQYRGGKAPFASMALKVSLLLFTVRENLKGIEDVTWCRELTIQP